MVSNWGIFLYYIAVDQLISFNFVRSSKRIYKDFV